MTTTAHRVLVVEDDPTINQALADRLVAEGFEVVRAHDGPGAVAAHAEHDPAVVVLDLMLPGYDGLEVCRRIQADRPVPVLMLTARDDESDIIVGLGVGADDYLTKPFRMREVVARVRALLRRVERAAELGRPDETITHLDGLTLDERTRRCTIDGHAVHLTPTEFDLLALLVHEPGAVLRRERIVADLWGWDDGLGRGSLDSHVKALRAKVGAHRIRTVHGVGYALDDGAGR
ncbi:response regulator transcription factor [Janibacter indicus]|uniref:DNA-binding response regulator, OmpR family, contains REC and winged-helix (WHTH) domain n=1 Tax=Janibacter indicus TaxID=857417 RepID=A0A1W1ZST1_9MICO|nr:response regulator transcription factor [Janibacter indicus]SMC51128.1 DNA-binding response regulator, OmpR family, contains REC and winged-helix (wHTH) domain [Janibacter indicus]